MTLTETQNANLGSFVDNARIWHSLNTIHSPKHLKTALDQIFIWAEDKNGDKFELLNFGESARTFPYEIPQGNKWKQGRV